MKETRRQRTERRIKEAYAKGVRDELRRQARYCEVCDADQWCALSKAEQTGWRNAIKQIKSNSRMIVEKNGKISYWISEENFNEIEQMKEPKE